MKTYIKLALVTLAIFATALTGSAQVPVSGGGGSKNDPPTVNQIADAFANQKVSYWRGEAHWGGTNYITCTIQRVRGLWAFTQMNVNGRELPIDPDYPLWQLPAHKDEATDFSFWINGFDNNGVNTRYGNFWSSKLAPSDDVTVTVYLNFVQKALPYTFSGGHNSGNTMIKSADGQYGGWYDNTTKSWIVWFDPINPPAEWILVDTRNNSPFGSISFSGPGGQSNPGGNGVVLVNQADIPELSLDNGMNWYGSLQGLKLNHSVVYNNTNYAGKVMLTSVTAKTDYVQLYASNLRAGSIVQVFGYKDGKPEHVGDWQLMPDQWQLVVNNITGYTDYKFVMIGALSDPIGGLGVSIYDSTGPWSDGKGKAEQ